jgi:DNA-binding transcriptional MerR regulator
MSEELLSTNEAAKRLRIMPQTLRKWRGQGYGPPYVRVGKARTGRVYYRISDMEAWLADRTFISTEEEKP